MIDEARLERLVRLASRLLRGRPLHHGGQLLRPRPASAGLEFLDHRPMILGDDPRHIDWRASARSRQPLVRRYRDERAGEWVVCLDRSTSIGTAGGAWPLARQLTAAFAYLLLNLEHRVGLALFSAEVDLYRPPARGRSAYIGLCRTLEPASPRSEGGASNLDACLPLLPRARQVAIVSDFLTPDSMKGALGAIVARCDTVHLFHILGRTHAPMPGKPLIVEDAETGERMTVDGADPGLEARLAARQRSLSQELEQFSSRRGALYSACPVGKPWDRVLLDHLVGPEATLA